MNDRSLDIRAFREAVKARKLEWQQHVLERLIQRNISRVEIVEILLTGERIEDYPDDYPWPSALFFAYKDGRPLHVVAALSPERQSVAIITAYEPDDHHFESDYITRKKR